MTSVKSRNNTEDQEELSCLDDSCISHSISASTMLSDLPPFDNQYLQGSMQWYLDQFQKIVSTIASWFDQGIMNLGEIIQNQPQLDFVFTRMSSSPELAEISSISQKKQQQQLTPEQILHEYIPEKYFVQLQHIIQPHPDTDANNLFKDSNSNFLGIADPNQFFNTPWELIVDEAGPGIRYRAYRRPLRKGLYIYKTSQIYAYTTVEEVSAFNVNKDFRQEWDSHTYKCFNLIESNAGQGEQIEGQKDAVMYMRTRYPGPMADREFVSAKRFWCKDGLTYCLSKSVDYDVGDVVGSKRGRTFKVEDYISSYVVRPVVDEETGAPSSINEVEFLGFYFEDPGVSSGIVNLIIRKGLWSETQKHEQALRLYQQWASSQQSSQSNSQITSRSLEFNHRLKQQKMQKRRLNQSLKFRFSRQDGRCVLNIDPDDGSKSTQRQKKVARFGAAAVLGLTILSKIIQK